MIAAAKDFRGFSRRVLRNQFNALKALNDAQAAQIAALTARVQALESGKASMDDVNAAIVADSSANCDSVDQLDLQPSDPPFSKRCLSDRLQGERADWHVAPAGVIARGAINPI